MQCSVYPEVCLELCSSTALTLTSHFFLRDDFSELSKGLLESCCAEMQSQELPDLVDPLWLRRKKKAGENGNAVSTWREGWKKDYLCRVNKLSMF